ncbi:MAG: IS66 family transposase [Verrucomicrobia bacterium]|nr:IS66 family transposase [Verrucomicrobiota bacterium]
MNFSTAKTIESIKEEYHQLEPSLSLEAKAFFKIIMSLLEVVIASLGKKATSQNSHLPPSRDPNRPRKQKEPKNKKPGGQKGHKGKSLVQVLNPDKIIFHPVKFCDSCGSSLLKLPCRHITKHQVFDIEFKVVVTEHQAEHKICLCGHHQSSKLPKGASAPCQYGPSLKAMAIDLSQIQFIPLQRTSQFFRNKFGLPLSEASILKFNKELVEKLEDWEKKSEENLKDSHILHADETGININGKNAWIHSVSNESYVFMKPHYKRGTEAMDEIGILNNYHGVLSHDFWACYGAYDVIHACCNSHIERELNRAYVDFNQKWAKDMSNLLQETNKLRNEIIDLDWEIIQSVEKRYDQIIVQAEKECPLNQERQRGRGKIGQSYPRRLLNRLKTKKSWVLMFIYDPLIPFTNNQAERDIRMAKVQQKVSGCFRTFEGARIFCLIRSFVLSMNRQGKNVQDAIEDLFRGT